MKQITAIWLLILSFIGVAEAQKSKITTKVVTLYGHTNHIGLNTYNAQKGVAMSLQEASYNPKNIHFGYLFGNTSKSTLLVPASKAYTGFNKVVTDAVITWKNNRNDGVFINLGNSTEALAIYDGVKDANDIEQLYHEYLEKVIDRDDYKRSYNGPSDNISDLKFGDIIIFKSEELEQFYLLKVTKLLSGHSGEITLELKFGQVDAVKNKVRK